MLDCPQCGNKMGWIGDNDTDKEGVYVTGMYCDDCKIEVNKAWGEGILLNGVLEVPSLSTVRLYETQKTYTIDCEKLNALDDVISVLRGMDIRYTNIEGNIPDYLKKYLKECD